MKHEKIIKQCFDATLPSTCPSAVIPASFKLPPQICNHDGRGDDEHQGGRGDKADPGFPQLQEAAHQHAGIGEGERCH